MQKHFFENGRSGWEGKPGPQQRQRTRLRAMGSWWCGSGGAKKPEVQQEGSFLAAALGAHGRVYPRVRNLSEKPASSEVVVGCLRAWRVSSQQG